MRTNYLTLLAGIVVLLFVAGCQSGILSVNDSKTSSSDGEEPKVVISTTRTADLPGGDVIVGEITTPTATPSPTATQVILPDRTTCEEIFGTAYHSDNERAWYLANCLPTPEPTASAEPVVTPDPLPAIPGPEVPGERWILVDIGTQTTTAMIGSAPLYTSYVTTGATDWETPTGTFSIIYRVENETMTSESIGADEYYVLEDVLYTQYFTNEGHALHLNYWRDDSYFGNIPSSHGCIGMRLADAEFFWNFANYGTRVTIQ